MGKETKTEWQMWVERFKELQRCLCAKGEGRHKVACSVYAEYESADGYPACLPHASEYIQRGWRGFVEGA